MFNSISGSKFIFSTLIFALIFGVVPQRTSAEFVLQTINVGNQPEGMVALGSNIYVVNEGDDTVSVVDTSTLTIIDTINVGDGPQLAVVLGDKIYVSNRESDNVSVIDTADDNSVETVSAGTNPYVMAVLGTKIYVGNSGESSVTVIESSDNSTETVAVGSNPGDIAVLGTKVYVGNTGDSTLSIIDTADSNSVTSVEFGSAVSNDTQSLAFLDDLLYVANDTEDGTISIVDTSDNNSVTTKVTNGSSPFSISVLGVKVYVLHQTADTVGIIDTGNGNSVSVLDVGGAPTYSLANGHKMYVANYSDGTVSIINTEDDNSINTVTTGAGAYAMVATGGRVYINNYNADTLSVILPSFTMSTTTVTVNENAGTSNFSVILDGEPDSNVVLNLSTAASIATTSVSQLTFTTENWDTPQTVTVTGITNSISSNTATTITLSVVDASSDDNFDEAPNQTVTVNVVNQDPPTDDNEEEVRRSSGGVQYGCGDKDAINYERFVRNDSSLCEYDNPSDSLENIVANYEEILEQLRNANINISENQADSLNTVRDLEFGDVGADVQMLQRLLNNLGFVLAKESYGSPGNETIYFGPLTRAALSAYQTANGIRPTDGYFGPITRAQMKSAGVVGIWW